MSAKPDIVFISYRMLHTVCYSFYVFQTILYAGVEKSRMDLGKVFHTVKMDLKFKF